MVRSRPVYLLGSRWYYRYVMRSSVQLVLGQQLLRLVRGVHAVAGLQVDPLGFSTGRKPVFAVR